MKGLGKGVNFLPIGMEIPLPESLKYSKNRSENNRYMQKILVTGGCGFIGSHTVVDLKDLGYSPLSIDNFSNANKAVEPILKSMTDGSFENAETLKDANTLKR